MLGTATSTTPPGSAAGRPRGSPPPAPEGARGRARRRPPAHSPSPSTSIERGVADVGACRVALQPEHTGGRGASARRSAPPRPSRRRSPGPAERSRRSRLAISCPRAAEEGVAEQRVAPPLRRAIPGPVGPIEVLGRGPGVGARGAALRAEGPAPQPGRRSGPSGAPHQTHSSVGASSPQTSGKRSAGRLATVIRYARGPRQIAQRSSASSSPVSRSSKSPTSIASARGSSSCR